jgi:hypothetical protein
MVLQSHEGAAGAGHSAALVESKNAKTGKTEWHYYSRNGEGAKGVSDKGSNAKGIKFDSPEDFFKKQAEAIDTRSRLEDKLDKNGKLSKNEMADLNLAKELTMKGEDGKYTSRYDQGVELKTSKSQDKAFEKYAKDNINKGYVIAGFDRNCKDLVRGGLNAAGYNGPRKLDRLNAA